MQVHRQLFLQEKDPEKGLACDDPFRLTPPLWAFPERAAFQCQRVPLFESIITDPCRSCRACSLMQCFAPLSRVKHVPSEAALVLFALAGVAIFGLSEHLYHPKICLWNMLLLDGALCSVSKRFFFLVSGSNMTTAFANRYSYKTDLAKEEK